MADREVESSDVEVPEIPEILEKVLLFSLDEAKEKMTQGSDVVPFTALVVKENLFIENHPADSAEECFNLARHTVEHARGAAAYALCYDGYIEIDDGVKDALIAEGGVPGEDTGYAVSYLYEMDEEGNVTFEEEPAYVGEAPNFMIALNDADSYSEEDIDEKYLEEDKTLLPVERNNSMGDFTSNRITHFNLYAVKALLARVYWTMNDLEKAEDYAQEVIDSGKFPLKTTAGAWNGLETGTLDMQETVVGLYSTTFTYYYYFDLIRSSTSMGSMKLAEQYTSIYEADQEGNADRRYVAWFDRNNNWCTKHYNVMYASSNASGSTATYNGNSIPGVSLIRIPEMYYIVAEANLTKDLDKATEYLDYVVTSRDQTAFADREAGKITEENIFNDRRKEFFADGGDFHNMKRLARDLTIPGMGTFAGNDDATYTMPIPASVEDNYRQ